MTPMKVGGHHVEALALGCALFGGGGGGSPELGTYMTTAALEECGPLDVVDLDTLDPDSIVLPIGMIGAPTVIVEKIPNGNEGDVIRRHYEGLLGRRVAALMPAELGGINGVLPLSWASRCGLPLADADLMGRAFPRLDMVLPAMRGIDISPAVLIDERGNRAALDVSSPAWAEKLARSVVVAMGATATMGIYPMTVAQARQATVRGSVTRSIAVGTMLSRWDRDPIDELRAELRAAKLIEGKLVDVDRQTVGGFARGSAVIAGTGGYRDMSLRLEFQNENLAAIADGEVVATVPDIITAVDIHTGWAVTTEHLRYGQRLAVLAFPADPAWYSAEGLALGGPRALGYDFDAVTVGESAAIRSDR